MYRVVRALRNVHISHPATTSTPTPTTPLTTYHRQPTLTTIYIGTQPTRTYEDWPEANVRHHNPRPPHMSYTVFISKSGTPSPSWEPSHLTQKAACLDQSQGNRKCSTPNKTDSRYLTTDTTRAIVTPFRTQAIHVKNSSGN